MFYLRKQEKTHFEKLSTLTFFINIIICSGDAHFQKRYFEALILFHYTF